MIWRYGVVHSRCRLKVVSGSVDLGVTWPVICTESSLSIVGFARGDPLDINFGFGKRTIGSEKQSNILPLCLWTSSRPRLLMTNKDELLCKKFICLVVEMLLWYIFVSTSSYTKYLCASKYMFTKLTVRTGWGPSFWIHTSKLSHVPLILS